MSLRNYLQEIVSLVQESVNNGASVEDRQQKDFVQVLSGSVIRYVEAVLFSLFLIFINFDYSVLRIGKTRSVGK